MADEPKIGVLLSGNGVFDGAEIHESVFMLYELEKQGAKPVCIAPDMKQHHVVNHTNGEEMQEERNVFLEAARIARGDIKKLEEVNADELDGLTIPGGFGAAKNLTKWAFEGPNGEIHEGVKKLILSMAEAQKPIGAVCMGPTVVAKALEGSNIHPKLTIGTTSSPSPYDIKGIKEGVEATGAVAEEHEANEVALDTENNIFTSPCYNMEASIVEIHDGIEKVVRKVVEMAQEKVGA